MVHRWIRALTQARPLFLNSHPNPAPPGITTTHSPPLQALHPGNTGMELEHWDRAVCRTAMLAAAALLDPVNDLSTVVQFLKRHTDSGQDQAWTTR